MNAKVVALVLLCAVGCSKSEGGGSAPRIAQGKERGDCVPAKTPDDIGTCDPGLLCLSNLCVRPPPADCQLVADILASFDLGNYAEPDERAPVVAAYKTACRKAYVSKEQGECIANATSKETAFACAPLMAGPAPTPVTPGVAEKPETTGDCTRIVDLMRTYMAKTMGGAQDPQTTKMLDAVLLVVGESCEQDGWPAPFKQCILAAKDSTDAMNQCNAQMPPDLQQKLTDRMMKVMQTMSPTPPPPTTAPQSPPF